MPPPEVVVFDLGKVLLDFDYQKAAIKFAAHSTVPPEAIWKFIDHSPLLFRFETGLMTKAEFFGEVRSLTGFQGGATEFEQIFCEIFEPIPPMIEFQASLRKRGIPTYIFSNTNALQLEYIRRAFPFFAGFDGYILSYEHGAMKPNAKLYEVVEQKTGRRREQILYLDDRAENVAAGAARGWQVILQETSEKTFAALKPMGLLG